MGLCQCNDQRYVDDVCTSDCRSSRYTIKCNEDGNLASYDTDDNVVSSLTTSTLTGLSGSCDYNEDSNNKVRSISNNNGVFGYNYQCSDELATDFPSCNAARRSLRDEHPRNLAPTLFISNPVICIYEDDYLMFDVDSAAGEYPAYVTGSLLNTNTNFDYSDFLTLASDIGSGSVVSYFLFKFNTEGIYVFENAADTSQQMVLGVMGEGSKCPSEDEYADAISLKALLLIGSAESDVVYEPNWTFIALLLLSMMIVIGVIIGVYYYFRRSWLTKVRRNIKYRRVNLRGEEIRSISADNACFTYLSKNKEQRIMKRINQKMNRDIRYSEIEDIRIRLKNHIDKLNGKLFGGVGDDDYTSNINLNINMNTDRNNILLQLQKLKELITDHKKNIEGEFDENYSDDDSSSKNDKKGKLSFLGDAIAASKRLGMDIVDEGNKQDDDELNKMLMQIRKRREKIDEDVNNEVEDEKSKLRRKLQNLGDDVDPDVRKRLLEELKLKLDKVDDTLKNEESAQKRALEAKLAQRKKRRGKIVDDYAQLQREKYELSDNTALRKKIDGDVENQIDKMEEELEKERQEGLDIIAENIKNQKRNKLETFENKLRKGANDKKNFEKYLEDYSKAEKSIQDEIRQEQMSQEQKLAEELRKRRDARLAKIEAQKGELIEDAKNDVKDKLRDLEEKERAFEGLKIKELDPFLKEIVKKSEQKVGNKRQLDLIRQEADKALLKYKTAENEERERIKKELMEKYKDLDAEEDNEIRSFREQLLKDILDKEEEKESTLAKLKSQLESAPSIQEKQKLIEQHNQYKNDIEDELQKMANDSTNKLKLRLRDRRAKRKQEEDKLLKERLDELNAKKQEEEDKNKMSYNDFREENEERTVEDIVRGLQAVVPKEEVPTALEKILDDRQMRELVDLLMRQYEEKAQKMKDSLVKLMDEKTNEIEDTNKEYTQAKKFLRDAYEKGGITEKAFNEEMDKLKDKLKQQLDAIHEKYNNLEMEREQDIRRAFIEKHTNEQIELEERHLREREKFFSKLLPESAMKRILRGYEELNDDEINDFIREKNEEKMNLLQFEMEGFQREYDDLEEYERKLRERELMEQRRFDIRKQKLLDEKKRQQEAELIKAKSEDQREDMIKKHLQELEDLRVVLDKERKRQLDIHEAMFNKKREAIDAKKKELKAKIEEEKLKKLQKMDEEQKRIQEMSELEKKRQEKLLKLQKEMSKDLFVYDKPAYSAQIDWADRLFKAKKQNKGASAINDAFKGGQKITKEERIKQRIASIQKSNKGPMSLELLARIERLEEIVTSMTDDKYAKVLEEFPEL
jgi:hypothetical protein